MFDVLAIGELNNDYIFSGLNSYPEFGKESIAGNFSKTLGSSTAICAVRMAGLGLKTTFSSLVGDDEDGRFALDSLKKRGVDVSGVVIDSDTVTGISVLLTGETDRAIITHLGAIGELSADRLDLSILPEVKHIHVGSYFLQSKLRPGLADLFRAAKGMGITTSLDAGWDDTGNWNYGIDDVLKYTDIFLPNETESLNITGEKTPEAAAKTLNVPYSVVKCGSDGAICVYKRKTYIKPCFNVTPVDTTGAGDSFNAGFIYGILKGYGPEKALLYGNACGKICVMNVGGTAGTAGPAEVNEIIQKGRVSNGKE